MNKVNKVTIVLVTILSFFGDVAEARGDGTRWGFYVDRNNSGRYVPPRTVLYGDYYDYGGQGRGYYYPPQQQPYYQGGVHYNPYMGLCKYARGYGPSGYHPCP